MIENGYYKVDSAYFNFFSSKYSCMFKFNKDGNRPVLCCYVDAKLKGLYWAVPTGRADNKDLSRINKYISLPKDKLGCNFYHIGYSNSRRKTPPAFIITNLTVLRSWNKTPDKPLYTPSHPTDPSD